MKFGNVCGMAIHGRAVITQLNVIQGLCTPFPCGRDGQLGHKASKSSPASAAYTYRRRLDCDTTLPANVLVTGAELGLSKARDARFSVWAPVWAELPAWRSAEPASDFWTALDDDLPNALPATEATWGEVCLLFLLMLNSWPHDSEKVPLRPRHPDCIFIQRIGKCKSENLNCGS